MKLLLAEIFSIQQIKKYGWPELLTSIFLNPGLPPGFQPGFNLHFGLQEPPRAGRFFDNLFAERSIITTDLSITVPHLAHMFKLDISSPSKLQESFQQTQNTF